MSNGHYDMSFDVRKSHDCPTCQFRQSETAKAIERECESWANFYANITTIGQIDRLEDCGYSSTDIEKLAQDYFIVKKSECFRQCMDAKMPK